MTQIEACRHCRTLLLPNHPTCLRCGRPGDAPPGEVRTCPICGLPAAHDARFCAGCGQSVEHVGRVVTSAWLHDPPGPPAPEAIWVDRRPSPLASWPTVLVLAVLVAVVAVYAGLR